jgi:hypothetical protein
VFLNGLPPPVQTTAEVKGGELMGKPEPDEVVELGADVAFMYHGVDLTEPAENPAEEQAQQDALEDYIPD